MSSALAAITSAPDQSNVYDALQCLRAAGRGSRPNDGKIALYLMDEPQRVAAKSTSALIAILSFNDAKTLAPAGRGGVDFEPTGRRRPIV